MLVNTEQFHKLVKVLMQSQRVPQSIAVEIDCNPEFVDDVRLEQIADGVIAKAVDRLTREHQV